MSEFPNPTALLAGRLTPPAAPVVLTAGPLRLHLIEGELRYLSVGGREAVRRIYAAVRDAFWNTVPGVITGMKVVQTADGFTAEWECAHVSREADFVWTSRVTGRADGTVRWEADGLARRTFPRNRIGFCVLHPLETCEGADCEVDHVSGETAVRKFPVLVDPVQPVRGLHDFTAIRYEVSPGVRVEVAFEGDVFEIEDQRNWTDGSFKSYCTPQRIPLPATVREGQRVRQVVTVRLDVSGGTAPGPAPVDAPAVVRVGAETFPLPAMGLGMASHGEAMDEREAALVEALRLDHLRVEVKLSEPGWSKGLALAGDEARRIGAGLEIALHLTGSTDAATLAEVNVEALATGVPVRRWLLIEEGKGVISPALLARTQHLLTEPCGTGTDIDFFPLNNNRPAPDSADFVFCSLRPMAHAFDDATPFENLQGLADVVRSARETLSPMPFVASPVTLRRRWVKGPPPLETELPPMVDPRQMSLLAAAWFTGTLRSLTLAGAVSATWCETTGWRGVLETTAGNPLPDEFFSTPGFVFPVWFVLRAVADFRGGEMRSVSLTNPLKCQAVALQAADGRELVIVANAGAEAREVNCEGLAGDGWSLRVLDAAAAGQVGTAPESWGQLSAVPWHGGALTLPPFAVAFLRRG